MTGWVAVIGDHVQPEEEEAARNHHDAAMLERDQEIMHQDLQGVGAIASETGSQDVADRISKQEQVHMVSEQELNISKK